MNDDMKDGMGCLTIMVFFVVGLAVWFAIVGFGMWIIR